VENTKPSYTVSVLLPALIFGPPIQPVSGLKKMNFSTDQFYSLFNGTHETVPPTPFPSYVSLSQYYLQFPNRYQTCREKDTHRAVIDRCP
jgi:hypothetical protein